MIFNGGKVMNRKDIITSPEYWTAGTQIELYNQALKFMEKNKMNRKELAEYLGVSKGYVTQLLNGDYDHRMSKFFELSLAFGVIPDIKFVPIDNFVTANKTSHVSLQISMPPAVQDKWSSEDVVLKYTQEQNLSGYFTTSKKTKEAA